MKWRILAVGKPSLEYARLGTAEYLGRLKRVADVEIDYLREGGAEANGERQLARSEGAFRIVLDERGEDGSSEELARRIGEWEMARHKRVAVIIGGADGHSDEVRRQGDWMLRLSRFTLQHELALVVWLEQLYRAYSIRRGEPYHR